ALPVVAASAVAPVRSLNAPQLDVMSRTAVTAQPDVTSKLDLRTTAAATKTLTTKGDAVVATRAEATESESKDTRIAAVSTGTATDATAAAEAQPEQARPRVMPACH